MAIYYYLFEAIPHEDNPERKEYAGAFVNCWVNSSDVNFALKSATSYVNDQGWEIIDVDEQNIVNRERYEEDDELEESLDCFDQAVNLGISAIFYTWPYDD